MQIRSNFCSIIKMTANVYLAGSSHRTDQRGKTPKIKLYANNCDEKKPQTSGNNLWHKVTAFIKTQWALCTAHTNSDLPEKSYTLKAAWDNGVKDWCGSHISHMSLNFSRSELSSLKATSQHSAVSPFVSPSYTYRRICPRSCTMCFSSSIIIQEKHLPA